MKDVTQLLLDKYSSWSLEYWITKMNVPQMYIFDDLDDFITHHDEMLATSGWGVSGLARVHRKWGALAFLSDCLYVERNIPENVEYPDEAKHILKEIELLGGCIFDDLRFLRNVQVDLGLAPGALVAGDYSFPVHVSPGLVDLRSDTYLRQVSLSYDVEYGYGYLFNYFTQSGTRGRRRRDNGDSGRKILDISGLLPGMA